jgi:GNAT superfamily N-acetyltransferase
MDKGLIIREITGADTQNVIDLLLQLNRFEHVIMPNRATSLEAAAASFESVSSRIAENGGAHLVAERGSRVIGYCACAIDLAPPYIREEDRRHVWVAELVVAEDARRQGVGEALLNAAEDYTRGQGLRHMLIGVLAGNDGADRLYQRMGYRHYSTERLKTLT